MVKKLLLGFVTASLLLSSSALACPKNKQMNTTTHTHKGHHQLVNDVVSAVSRTGLNAAQTKKVAEGISEYQATMLSIRQMRIFPIDSFINDRFDEKNFISEMGEKSQARTAAKAALFKYVFAILDDEQRKIFKREYAAPLIEKMIRMHMSQGMPMGIKHGKKKHSPMLMSPKGCRKCNK